MRELNMMRLLMPVAWWMCALALLGGSNISWAQAERACNVMRAGDKVKKCFSAIDASIGSRNLVLASSLISNALNSVVLIYESDDAVASEREIARVTKSYLMYYSGRVDYINGDVEKAIGHFHKGVTLLDGADGYANVFLMNDLNLHRLYAELYDYSSRLPLLDGEANYFSSMKTVPVNIIFSYVRWRLLLKADAHECVGAEDTAAEMKELARDELVGRARSVFAAELSEALMVYACGNFSDAAKKTRRVIDKLESNSDLIDSFSTIMYANMARHALESGDDVMAQELLRKAWGIALRFSLDTNCMIRSGLARRASMSALALLPGDERCADSESEAAR